MTDELKPCPKCKNSKIDKCFIQGFGEVHNGKRTFYCCCHECGHKSKTYKAIEKAIKNWNRRVEK